jgi:hypothetical protein
MLPRMDVSWFDIRKHPSGLVLRIPARPDDGGNGLRVILTKPFDGPYILALILGLSPGKTRDSDLRATACIGDRSKVQLRNDNESLKNYRI